jgi:UDP-N-acetylglucosamine acyltransferase
MNTGTAGGGGVTRVGKRGFFMAYSHVGHDCIVGDDVIFANSATLGGHCMVGDSVFIGGLTAVHQHSRIGSQAMVAGMTGVRGDVIPYGFATGQHAALEGLNVVGMRRRKFTRERLHRVRAFYQELFLGPGTFAERLTGLQSERDKDPAIADILDFLGNDAKRALVLPRGAGGAAAEEA